MEFRKEMIHKTAKYYARERKHPEIVELLSKGPSETYKSLLERNKELHCEIRRMLREKRHHNNTSPVEPASGCSQHSEEIDKLNTYLSLLKKKTAEIKFVNIYDYEDESVIGEGSSSCVKVVSTKKKYAKKELKLFSQKEAQRFLQEGEILSILRHPCIVDIVGFSLGDKSHPPSIFLSLEPKSLESAIAKKELSEEDKNRITVEVVLGMRYIHSRHFMHRDLKPSNILLSANNQVRISDFGLAREDDLSASQTKNVGTLRFMAPELFEEEESREKYTNKVDVYSFGITLIYIVTDDYAPFSMKNAVNGVTPKLARAVVGWVSELISRCLSPKAENRPSFNEIFELMKSHDYDMFREKSSAKLTKDQLRKKKSIDTRVLEIEAFEYQHRED